MMTALVLLALTMAALVGFYAATAALAWCLAWLLDDR